MRIASTVIVESGVQKRWPSCHAQIPNIGPAQFWSDHPRPKI